MFGVIGCIIEKVRCKGGYSTKISIENEWSLIFLLYLHKI